MVTLPSTVPQSQARDQRVAARRDVARVALQARQRGGGDADAFLGHRLDERIAVGRVEPLGGVGDGVEQAHDRDREGQRRRQLGVVDDRSRQHARVAAGRLHAGVGEAVDRRHLAAGVGRRHRDHGQRRSRGRSPCRARSSSRRRSRPRCRRRARRASSHAARAVATGTCIAAPAKTPTARSPSRAATRSASARWPGVERTRARPRPSAASSSRQPAQRAGAEDDARQVRREDEVVHAASARHEEMERVEHVDQPAAAWRCAQDLRRLDHRAQLADRAARAAGTSCRSRARG